MIYIFNAIRFYLIEPEQQSCCCHSHDETKSSVLPDVSISIIKIDGDTYSETYQDDGEPLFRHIQIYDTEK